jgi:hypothetical protein
VGGLLISCPLTYTPSLLQVDAVLPMLLKGVALLRAALPSMVSVAQLVQGMYMEHSQDYLPMFLGTTLLLVGTPDAHIALTHRTRHITQDTSHTDTWTHGHTYIAHRHSASTLRLDASHSQSRAYHVNTIVVG